MTAAICIFSEPDDYRIMDGKTVWHFDWSERYGPSLTNGKGDILAKPWPVERSPFWRCFGLWHNQGKRWEPSDTKGVRLALWDEPPAGRVTVSPDLTKQRGAVVQVVRQMDEILAIAIGVQRTAQ